MKAKKQEESKGENDEEEGTDDEIDIENLIPDSISSMSDEEQAQTPTDLTLKMQPTFEQPTRRYRTPSQFKLNSLSSGGQ